MFSSNNSITCGLDFDRITSCEMTSYGMISHGITHCKMV